MLKRRKAEEISIVQREAIDRDFLRLTMFQHTGGSRAVLLRDADGIDNGLPDKTFVGSTASGIDVIKVPEPASIGLFAFCALGLIATSAVNSKLKSSRGL